MDWTTIIIAMLVPVTGIVTWVFSKPKRKAEAVNEMQTTIDLLFDKNQELYGKIIELQERLTSALDELGEYKYTLKGLGAMAERNKKS
ncbi:MAG: hypothetical protein LBN95_07055 [Prevotellaceae bacterium]|jgi:hypothetical protein|nr:hypothetical protein [Prevotellaceae bacterium]